MIEVRKTAVVDRGTPAPEDTRELYRWALREDLYGPNKENVVYALEMRRCPQCSAHRGEHKLGCALQVRR